MRAREGKLGEKGGRLGGTSLILVQTKVSDPMGPLLTIQEDWANAHIHSLPAIIFAFFDTKIQIPLPIKIFIIRHSANL